jgi:thiol-disulfide isomerase/thioredoxin
MRVWTTAVVTAMTAASLAFVARNVMAEAEPAPLELAQAGRSAPNFVGVTQWFNSDPLSIEGLRGKVVMVNFWTYGCYNCVNALPHVRKLYEKYKDSGFVVVGVHTPEFPREKSAANVQSAIKRHGITYPVAQDNDYATWKNYGNRYWPAQYIIDRSGRIVFTHAGEGEYDTMDRTVQKLVAASS